MTDYEKFIQSIYYSADEAIIDVYKEQKKDRNELLNKIAMILLIYEISDKVIKLKKSDFSKENALFYEIIARICKKEAELTDVKLKSILYDSVSKIYHYRNYNVNRKDVLRVVNSDFKGKTFSDRIWGSYMDEVAKGMQKNINDFLKGKINVNQIKSIIDNQFNNTAYNTRRLVNTEVSRSINLAFDEYCKATNVKKVRYNSVLENNTCKLCAGYHGKIFDVKNKPEIPEHPLCKCFYEIVE